MPHLINERNSDGIDDIKNDLDGLLQVVEVIDEYQTACVPGTYTDNEQRAQFIQDVNTDKSCNRSLTVSSILVSCFLMV